MFRRVRVRAGVYACFLLAGFSLFEPSGAAAAVVLNAAVSSASFINPAFANGKLAEGVLFVAFGQGMGPAALAQASSFPLPKNLSGTSIRVTVGTTTRDCIIFYTVATQVAAMLPSNTPTGAGTMVLTYNGESSAPLNITVAAHAFGFFALNSQGNGPGVFTNPLTNVVNGLTTSANPNDLLDIWGTGVGPVAGDEAAGPLPGDLTNVDVKVWVGGKQAQVLYRGRSGCCAALDQIRIVVPNVTGCYVPIYMAVEGVVSNFVTVSIAESGSKCSDQSAGGITEAERETILRNGVYRTGSVSLNRFITDSPSGQTRADSISAGFYSYPASVLNVAPVGAIPAAGACSVTYYPGNFTAPFPTGLNAGTVSVSGPVGTHNMPTPAFSPTGIYSVAFVPGSPSSAGLVGDGTVLTAGTYTITGTGGTAVGLFSVSVDFPASFDWTNRASISTVNLNQPLTVTWTGGTPGALAYIHGRSGISAGVGADFTCWADATAGTFTVPVSVLAALPPSYVESNNRPTGVLDVYQFTLAGFRFSAPGTDYSWATWADGNLKGGITYH